MARKILGAVGRCCCRGSFTPNTSPAKIESNSILKALAEAYRQLGKVLTGPELRIYRRNNKEIPADITIRKSFPTKHDLLNGLADWLKANSGYEDVAAMLAHRTADPQPKAWSRAVEGSVYLWKSGAHYKIGRSDDLERRARQVRLALPEKLTEVHSIRTDDPPGIEAYWHRRFADRRARGEWFKLTSSDVAAFKRRKFQ